MALVRWLRSILSAVFVLLSLLALAEVGLRIARLETVQRSNESSIPGIAPEWKMVSEITGFEVRPHIRGTDEGELGLVSWKTNSWGMRGPEPQLPKPSDTFRILVLGDEALFAAALPDDALLARQLSFKLNSQSSGRVEVLSAAVPAACPETLLLAYQRRFSPIQPDVVLVHLSSQSIQNSRHQRRWMRRDSQGQVIACTNPASRSQGGLSWIQRCRAELAIIDWIFEQCHQRWPELQESHSASSATTVLLSEDDYSRPLEALLNLNRYCQSQGTKLIVYFSPVMNSLTTPADHAQLVATTGPILQASQIPAIDALAWLTPDMVETSGGWTSRGHQRLAECVAMQFIANLAGPWQQGLRPSEILPVGHELNSPQKTMPQIQRPARVP